MDYIHIGGKSSVAADLVWNFFFGLSWKRAANVLLKFAARKAHHYFTTLQKSKPFHRNERVLLSLLLIP